MYEDVVARLRYKAGFQSDHWWDSIYDEAADAIEALNRDLDFQIRAAKADVESVKPHWIPVNERLPETYGTRLVTTARGSVMVCCYYPRAKNWNTRATVTHWMPLPESPQEEA